MADFLERLRSGPPIVADGGLGALLSGAVAGLRCPEEANLRAPESVVAVHASYIRAGAELIETNTFGASRRKLAAHFLEDEFEAINSAGVRLAREAREVSGRDVFVAGAIGPLGELEMFDAAEHGPLYAEQARILEGRGVDLFMLETFFDLDELVAAVRGASRGVSSLPIVALLTFDDDAETSGGVGAAEAAGRLAALGVAAIGREPRRRAARRADRAGRDGRGRRCRWRRCRTSASPASPAAASSTRTRHPTTSPSSRPRQRPRRAHRRRLLRHHPRTDRGDPRTRSHEERQPRVAFERGRARDRARRARRRARRRGSRALCARASGSSASSSTRPRAAPTPP